MEGSAAERRQLTVLFCDLVESMSLAGQLDLEAFCEDSILAYFEYPQAHEDAALAILDVVRHVGPHRGTAQRDPAPVRIGIHTGVVVVGEIGTGTHREQLTLASRILALARRRRSSSSIRSSRSRISATRRSRTSSHRSASSGLPVSVSV